MIETTGQRNLKKTQKVSLMIKFIKIFVLALLLPVAVNAEDDDYVHYYGYQAQRIIMSGEILTSFHDDPNFESRGYNFIIYHVRVTPRMIRDSIGLSGIIAGIYICIVGGLYKPSYSCHINLK